MQLCKCLANQIKYFLVDLEKTKEHEKIIYWQALGHGYTDDLNKAGIYDNDVATSNCLIDGTGNTIKIKCINAQ